MNFTCPYCSDPTGITAEGLVEHIKARHPAPPPPSVGPKSFDIRITVDEHNARAICNLLSEALAVECERKPAASSPSADQEKGGR